MSQFITSDLALRYGVRLCHMFTVCALSGKAIFEYLFGTFTALSSGEGAFAAVLGVILIVSGVVNMILQKPSENLKESKGFWMKTLYAKFVITCLVLTPIPKVVGFSRDAHICLQFYTVVAMIIVSPILRFYREYYTEFNKQRKFSYENMEVLK